MLAKLVGALRLQDDASTLRGILEALARGASTEAARCGPAVDGNTLHSFADYGYLAGARPTDTPLESFASIGAVVRANSASSSPRRKVRGCRGSIVHARDVRQLWNRGAVSVASSVVAVLFAEGTQRIAGQTATSVWMEHVDLAVRHASSRLRNITSRRTVEVPTSTTENRPRPGRGFAHAGGSPGRGSASPLYW